MLGVYHRDSTRNAIWVASALLLGLLASASSARATPVLQVNGGGILTGVQDVVVAGSTYDVTFESGTCADVFGTCETSSFTFHTSSRAVAASNSLLSALSGSAFDGNPADVCYPTICYIYTPFAAPLFPFNNFEAYVDVSALDIFFETPLFLSGPGVLPVGTASLNGEGFVWAVWSATETPVPEPAPIALLGPAVLGVMFMGRPRFKADATR